MPWNTFRSENEDEVKQSGAAEFGSVGEKYSQVHMICNAPRFDSERRERTPGISLTMRWQGALVVATEFPMSLFGECKAE